MELHNTKILALLAFSISLGAICLWIAKRIQVAYFSPIAKIPCAHPIVPLSRIWILYMKWKGCENDARFRAHKRLGPVIRIAPRSLSVNCIVDGVDKAYGSSFDKPLWYEQAFRGQETSYMFTMLSKQEHTERRRMLAAAYSKTSVQNSTILGELSKDVIAGRLQNRLNACADSQAVVDILRLTKVCLIDFTTGWLFGPGHGTNFLRDDIAADEFLVPFKRSSLGFFWRSEFHNIVEALHRFRLHMIPLECSRSRAAVQDWFSTLCEKRAGGILPQAVTGKGKDQKNDSSISKQLYLALEQSQLSSDQARVSANAELLDHLVASHDVTGIALTYLIYELSQRLSLQESLRKELQSLSPPQETQLAHRIDALPLLNAIVMETLRLHSPNPGPWPRVVPTSGCRLGMYDGIPPGTEISASSYILHRNSTVFPQPEEWRPERWLEADATRRKEMARWFWAFGSGARVCIGNHFALRAMKAVTATVYAEYKTRIEDDKGMAQIDGVVAGPIADRLLIRFSRVDTGT
ncbi:hypothetical protein MMC27_006767 [Xylographa pallens]|nr:hypothetical protein [Xylographa pallens]